MNQKVAGATLALFATAMFLAVFNSTRHEVDMLLVNGAVYTLDAENKVAQAVAIRGNRIAAVGTSGDLRRRFDSDTVIDLEGKTLVPGFIDAHAHMSGLGQLMQSVILVGTASPEEIVGLVRDRAGQIPPGAWIHGRGWDQNRWEKKEFPAASQLDAVSPENPVVLIRIDGHAIWVNSRAVEIAHVNRDTKDPPGPSARRAASPKCTIWGSILFASRSTGGLRARRGFRSGFMPRSALPARHGISGRRKDP